MSFEGSPVMRAQVTCSSLYKSLCTCGCLSPSPSMCVLCHNQRRVQCLLWFYCSGRKDGNGRWKEQEKEKTKTRNRKRKRRKGEIAISLSWILQVQWTGTDLMFTRMPSWMDPEAVSSLGYLIAHVTRDTWSFIWPSGLKRIQWSQEARGSFSCSRATVTLPLFHSRCRKWYSPGTDHWPLSTLDTGHWASVSLPVLTQGQLLLLSLTTRERARESEREDDDEEKDEDEDEDEVAGEGERTQSECIHWSILFSSLSL